MHMKSFRKAGSSRAARHTDSRPTAAVLRDVLQQKCDYKAIAVPTFAALVPHREALEGMWSDMLSHQLPVLPPLNDFWDALPEIFAWIMGGAEIPQRALIQHGAGEIAVRTRVLPMGVPVRSRSTLETIRFAAANYLCVDLTHDGGVRRIEPYSLRQTAEGNYVLHAIRADSGDHRSYRVDRMQGAAVTSQVFTPRYAIELTSTGPLAVAPSTAAPRLPSMPRIPRASRPARTRRQGPTYIYRCTVCPGRTGVYVRTKY